eukprot:9492055-Pyramimonas_sp.AAC.1
MPGQAAAATSTRGARPGPPPEDLLFSLAFTRPLWNIRGAVRRAGISMDERIRHDHSTACIDRAEAPQDIGDITYTDDAAFTTAARSLTH